MIVCDFNFHVDDHSDTQARRFLAVLDNFNLKLLVSQSTHECGHTLDLNITRLEYANFLLRDVYMSNVSFSDHSFILFKLNHTKPPPRKITINHRSLSKIDFAAFNDDISSSLLFNDDCDDLSSLVTRYNQVPHSLLDAHSPSRQRSITVRPKGQWYTSEIASQKRLRRRSEHLWHHTKSQMDRKQYQKQCCVLNDFLYASKQAYYCEKIKDNSYNAKSLFLTINKLLQINTDHLYLSSNNDSTLANTSADFFVEKILNICTSIYSGCQSNLGVISLSPVTCTACFSSFCQVDCSVVHKLLTGLTKKSFSLDPLPACVLKECCDTLLPIFTRIINCSLSHRVMPESLECYVVTFTKKIKMLIMTFSPIFAPYQT